MKKNTVIYWTATVIAMLTGATSGYFYFTNPMMIGVFHHLGFRDHFRQELGLLKVLGSLAILIPKVSSRIKEWTYFGFGITFLSGTYAHLVIDGLGKSLFPLIPFVFLVISYLYFHKLNNLTTLN
ncbi:DoxX family protein [Chryseobacterium gambrini]|uniref:DoxX-like family protein n=1 Tax=Chryseobacterium gambrini TaxID=373672 RepID=A0A1N7MKH1_9FLAO|nr:DoxX family protein [Chryseobacterium gambrini]SIS86512.1 DoxX-like family protein [Chryseobacterium gambrini]